MEILLRVFDVLFPVFLTIAIGYWYGKKNPKFETTTITNFAMPTSNCYLHLCLFVFGRIAPADQLPTLLGPR